MLCGQSKSGNRSSWQLELQKNRCPVGEMAHQSAFAVRGVSGGVYPRRPYRPGKPGGELQELENRSIEGSEMANCHHPERLAMLAISLPAVAQVHVPGWLKSRSEMANRHGGWPTRYWALALSIAAVVARIALD